MWYTDIYVGKTQIFKQRKKQSNRLIYDIFTHTSFWLTQSLPTMPPPFPVSCLPSSLWAGLLAGTLAIPLLYYGYTFILGRDLFLLDLGTFLLSVLIAFRIACRLALSCRGKPYGILLGCFVCILLACFLWFTYHPPKAGLFTDPTAREEAV